MLSKKDFEFKQLIFVSAKDGEKIAIKNSNIVITDKDDNIIHQSTCYRLFAIFVIGNISLTSILIQNAKKYGFAIVLMTYSFRPYLTISFSGDANTMLRKKQYEYTSISAAKSLIANKIKNQCMLVGTLRSKSEIQSDAVSILNSIALKIFETKDIYEIMGLEGVASRVYFKAYFDNVEWRGRQPRLKADMVNSLLDLGYTIMFDFLETLLSIYGFDLYCGILHKQFYMRKSLVCDIIEPFRIVIDKTVKKSINLGQFKSDDFEIKNNQWHLKREAASRYCAVFIKEIIENKESIFLYVQDFYRKFMKGKLDCDFPAWSI